MLFFKGPYFWSPNGPWVPLGPLVLRTPFGEPLGILGSALEPLGELGDALGKALGLPGDALGTPWDPQIEAKSIGWRPKLSREAFLHPFWKQVLKSVIFGVLSGSPEVA